MMAKKPKYVAYCRVSTDGQGRTGLGLDAQKESVRAFARSRGGEIIAPEYVEVESGKNDKRPELEKAIARCRKTGATLLVAKLDRLSRNVEFLMALRNSGVDLAAADMPEANTLMFTVMAGLAQYEREVISKRTVDALAALQRQRREYIAYAQANYFPPRMGLLGGFRRNAPDIREYRTLGVKKWKMMAQEAAEMVREDIEPRVREGLSLRAIAARLNDAGILTPRSKVLHEAHKLRPENKKAWTAQGVANVIERLGINRPAKAA